ncbi:MAG TPA: hypothetical protein VFZ61_25920, partial [Polyangiales bacterium]
MAASTEKLELALAAFRRDHALDYVRTLAGAAPGGARARAFLRSDEALEGVVLAAQRGELPPDLHAAWCAHLARAHAEA